MTVAFAYMALIRAKAGLVRSSQWAKGRRDNRCVHDRAKRHSRTKPLSSDTVWRHQLRSLAPPPRPFSVTRLAVSSDRCVYPVSAENVNRPGPSVLRVALTPSLRQAAWRRIRTNERKVWPECDAPPEPVAFLLVGCPHNARPVLRHRPVRLRKIGLGDAAVGRRQPPSHLPGCQQEQTAACWTQHSWPL